MTHNSMAHNYSLAQWPLVMVLVTMAIGCVLVALDHWRIGAIVLGAAVLGAGVLRAILPATVAGLLVVRTRWLDTLIMLGSGLAMVVLALVIPIPG